MMLQLPSSINALACKGDITLAAIGGGRITVVHRTQIIHTWDGHNGTVLQMLVLDKLLLSLGSDKYLKVWQLDLRLSSPMVRTVGAANHSSLAHCALSNSVLRHKLALLSKICRSRFEKRLQTHVMLYVR
jgi:hypothetical protein